MYLPINYMADIIFYSRLQANSINEDLFLPPSWTDSEMCDSTEIIVAQVVFMLGLTL